MFTSFTIQYLMIKTIHLILWCIGLLHIIIGNTLKYIQIQIKNIIGKIQAFRKIDKTSFY